MNEIAEVVEVVIETLPPETDPESYIPEISLFDVLQEDHLPTMEKDEFDRLSSQWAKSSFKTLGDSLIYHADKHHGGMQKMLRKADLFNKRGASTKLLDGGGTKWTRKDGEFLMQRDGKTVSYGKNEQ